MIDEPELRRLIRDTESDRVERTVSTNNTDKFAQAVTAFSNDVTNRQAPGYLIIGVDDLGRPNQLKVTDELLKNLAALRSDGNIQPLPVIRVAKFELAEGDVALVEVLPSDLPPVRYKGQIWIRVGPRRGIANEQEERILTEKRIAYARSFDALPCLGSSLDALAVDVFQLSYLSLAVAAEVLAENNRELVTQLASLRFFDPRKGCPTNAGILLFAKNPLEWIPGAYVQFVRVDGTTLAEDIQAEQNISGDLLTVLRELESLIDVQLQQRPVIESTLRERMVFIYPREALRELIVNAVLHRSYESTAPVRFYWFSDHIEIQSPGGLYGEASPENFPNQNSYRNPVLAEAMKTLGFVNRFGRGVIRAQAALKKNGNKPAEFHFDHGFVRVTIWALA